MKEGLLIMMYHMPMGTAPSVCRERRFSLISAFTGRALVFCRVGGREESGLPPDINEVFYRSQLNRIAGQSSQ